MNIKAILLASLIAAPVPVFAQQTNIYQTCTNYQENYNPGYYDQYGNYIQGNVNTQRYNVQCGTGTYYRPNNGGYPQQYYPQQQYRQRVCNPTAGAALGAGLASAITGNSYNYGGSYQRNYNRNSSSGSWSNYGTNSNGWTLFGAGLGALMFSC